MSKRKAKAATERGVKMLHGKGWRLIRIRPGALANQKFVATLRNTEIYAGKRVATFVVHKVRGE